MKKIFQGKRLDNGKLMKGNLLTSNERYFIVDKGGEWLINILGRETFDDNYMVEVIPETVKQL